MGWYGRGGVRWIIVRWVLSVGCVLAIGGLVVGCADVVGTPAAAALEGLRMELTTEPQPPEAGNVTLTLRISDGAGAPVGLEDGQVHIVGDMPSMGHGGIEG